MNVTNSKDNLCHILLRTLGYPSLSLLISIILIVLLASISTLTSGNFIPFIVFLGLILLFLILYDFDLMFYGFIYSLPIFSQFGGDFAIFIIRTYGLLIIGYWAIRKLITERAIHLPPKEINNLFIFLGLLILTSSAYNIDRLELEDTFKIIAFCALFYAYYDWSYGRDWHKIAWSFLYPLALSAGFLIFKLAADPSIGGIMKLTLSRYSTFVNDAPNVLGAYLCIAVPPAFVIGIFGKSGFIKKYSMILLPLALLALFISNSRAAYLGVGISLLTLALIFRKTRIPLALLLLSTIVIFLNYPIIQQAGGFVLRLNADPTSRRTVVWESSIQNITKNPIWGSGLGNEVKDISDDLSLAAYKHEFGSEVSAHDLFLNKAVEFGVMGVALIIYLNYVFIKIIIRNFRTRLTHENLILNYSALGIVISLFMRSIVEHSVWISGTGMFPEFYSWVIMAWVFQIYQQKYGSYTDLAVAQ